MCIILNGLLIKTAEFKNKTKLEDIYFRNLTLLLNHRLCLYAVKEKVLLPIYSKSFFKEEISH